MKGALLAAVLLSAAACTPPRAKGTPGDYFPLAVGHEWLYRVTQPGAPARLLHFRIVGEKTGDRGETRFLLDDTGSRFYLKQGDVLGYSISPDIWTIFLSGPVVRGHRFDGALAVIVDYAEPPEGAATPTPPKGPAPMQIVKSSGYKLITETKRAISVPAGDFADCVEVTHLAGPTTGVKYFAPDIGLVFAEAWYEDTKTKSRSMVSKQELIGYRLGARAGGDLNLNPTPRTTTSSTP